MADHLGSGPDDLRLLSLLRQQPAPSHDDDQLSDICDVGDGPQSVVHHDLLQRRDIRMQIWPVQLSFYCPVSVQSPL